MSLPPETSRADTVEHDQKREDGRRSGHTSSIIHMLRRFVLSPVISPPALADARGVRVGSYPDGRRAAISTLTVPEIGVCFFSCFFFFFFSENVLLIESQSRSHVAPNAGFGGDGEAHYCSKLSKNNNNNKTKKNKKKWSARCILDIFATHSGFGILDTVATHFGCGILDTVATYSGLGILDTVATHSGLGILDTVATHSGLGILDTVATHSGHGILDILFPHIPALAYLIFLQHIPA